MEKGLPNLIKVLLLIKKYISDVILIINITLLQVIGMNSL
jgi:hypothetical protein